MTRIAFPNNLKYLLIFGKVRVPHDNRPGASSSALGVVLVGGIRHVRLFLVVLAEMYNLFEVEWKTPHYLKYFEKEQFPLNSRIPIGDEK